MKALEERLSIVEKSVQMAGLTTKEVLNFDEAASFIGISKSWLYKLTSRANIPHYKPSGKMCYFNRLELEAWLQQNRVSTSDEIEAKAQTYCIGNKKGGKK
jgi:excisionase family DNA binding protein